MKKIILSAVLFTVFLCLSCGKDESKNAVKELKSGYVLGYYVGDVKVLNNGKARDVKVGMSFSKGDVISTGKGAIAEISVNKKGFIKVSPNSSMTMAELISGKDKNIVGLDIDKGKILVGLSKLKKGSEFKIKSRTAVASVRGTVFRVASEQKSAKIQVVKGVVRVNPVKDGKVLTNVEVDVSKGKAVDLSEKKVQEIVEKKETLEVKKLDVSELEEISKDIKETQVVAQLDTAAKKESAEVLEETKSQITELKDEEEQKNLQKEQKEKALREQQAKARAAQKAKEAEKRRLADIEKLKKEEELKRKKEELRKKAEEMKKKKEDRVKNVPNL